MKRKLKGLVAGASALLFTAFIGAKNTLATSGKVTDAFSTAGIKKTGDMSGFFADLNGIVVAVMTVGAFWCITWLIVAGMKLAGSNGNPQKRNEGIGALFMVLCGLFIIYKSFDIAAWATGIGS